MEFEPAFREALWQDAEEGGAGSRQVPGAGLEDGIRHLAIRREIEVERLAFFPIRGDLENRGAAQASVREEHLFAKRLMIGGGGNGRGNTGKVAVATLLFLGENKRNEGGPRFYNFQPELPRKIIPQSGGADFWYGKTARRDDQDGSAKLSGIGMHHKFRAVPDFPNCGVEKYFDAGFAALRFEHIGDVLCTAIAEKLAERLLVIGNTMFFDERDEVRWRVSRQGGLREVFVGTDEIFGVAMNVREVAAAAARDKNLLADAIGAFEDCDAASTFAGFGRAEETCSASTENKSVKFAGQMNSPLRATLNTIHDATRNEARNSALRQARRHVPQQLRGRKLSLRSFLRVN